MRSFCYVLCLFVYLGGPGVSPAYSELYKCGDVWSTSPCADGSAPVTDLPDIRGAPQSGAGAASVPPIAFGDLCAEGNAGKLHIAQVSVAREEDHLVLEVEVANQERRNFSGSLHVSVSAAKNSLTYIRQATNFIPFKSSDTFAIPLRPLGPANFIGNVLTVQLLYAPSQGCSSRKVAVPGELSESEGPQTQAREAAAVIKYISEEQQAIYQAIPDKDAAVSAFLLQVLQFKAQTAEQRAAFYCKQHSDARFLQQCLVVRRRLSELQQLLHKRRVEAR